MPYISSRSACEIIGCTASLLLRVEAIGVQVSSRAADDKVKLAEKQAELDKAVHQFRSGSLTAEAARQIIAQVHSVIQW